VKFLSFLIKITANARSEADAPAWTQTLAAHWRGCKAG
jgi:hypothetical protein